MQRQHGPRVNPRMYGIFLEEINHGVDGGLYAELVRNRGFEDGRPPEGYELRGGRWVDANGFPAGVEEFGYKIGGLPFWSLVRAGDATGAMHWRPSGGITKESSYCLRLEVEELAGGQIGVANEGFFGIGVRQRRDVSALALRRAGEEFQRAAHGAAGRCGRESLAPMRATFEWHRRAIGSSFKPTLIASKTDEAKARLVILAGATGTRVARFRVALSGEDLERPAERFAARHRADDCRLEAGLRAFSRRLRRGRRHGRNGLQLEAHDRPGRESPGALGAVELSPHARHGPLRVFAILRRHRRGAAVGRFLRADVHLPPLSAARRCPWTRWAGSATTFWTWSSTPTARAIRQWGAKRAAAGHAEPFGFEYVEIGNENQGPELRDRYLFIYDAMKARYPDLKYLADLSWTSDESMQGAVFDIVDRHYYQNPRWFQSRFQRIRRSRPQSAAAVSRAKWP